MERPRSSAIIVALLILFSILTVWVAVAEPLPSPYLPPHGCAVVKVWKDDGSALAYCENGAMMAFDPDGQPYENAAGVPVRFPGWYEYHGPYQFMSYRTWGRDHS